MIKEAYELGVRQALEDAGLVKKSEVTKEAFLGSIAGGLYGGMKAPEGEGGRGALGGALGTELFGGAGALAGGGGGLGIAALLAALSKNKIPMDKTIAPLLIGGAGAGALGGGIYGAGKGRKWFTSED